MLKGNLSTRPFYNERAVNVILAIAAVGGLALAVFNTTRILQYSGERAQRTSAQAAAEAAAKDIRAAADREMKQVDRTAMARLGGETQQANDLIDKRLFSWTVFFGLVEKTMPMDARLVAVAPSTERGEFRIAMTVNAKRPEDLSAFLDALQGTGAFYDMLASEQQRNEDGTYDATVAGGYLPPAPIKASTAAGGAKRP